MPKKRLTRNKTLRRKYSTKRKRMKGGMPCIPCIPPVVSTFSGLASAGLAAGVTAGLATSNFSQNSQSRSHMMKTDSKGNKIFTYEGTIQSSKQRDKSSKKHKRRTKIKDKKSSISIVMKGKKETGWKITTTSKGDKGKSKKKTISLQPNTSESVALKRFKSLICGCENKGYSSC